MSKCDLAAYPVAEIFEPLRRALREEQRAVLSAPTGSGKSTVLPLALLDEPWLDGRKIIILEPRRIAAYAVASQLAANLGCEVGGTVGYRMRLERKVSAATRIEVLTEGMLTRKLQRDPELSDTALVIFDEFHERSLQADLALALTLDAAESLRDDLRILVMSATIDSAATAALLGGVPQITSSGRSFPVDIKYFPRQTDRTLSESAASLAQRAYLEEPGSMLVFLPGEADIRSACEILERNITDPACDIIPLYGRLDNSLQRKAIEPAAPGRRKIVLATSIAESSLTIDGVRVVIDSGFTRIARYQLNSNLERLETLPVTRDAAAQRAGRAGRTEPGCAWRMWSEHEEVRREAVRPSQMSYADLSGMVLELAAWGVSNIEELKFMEPPPAASITSARTFLQKLGALDAQYKITPHGRLIHDAGLSVRSGHLIAVANRMQMPETGIKIAALLDGVDMRRCRFDDINTMLNLLDSDKTLAQAKRLAAEVEKRMRGKLHKGVEADHSVGKLLAAAFPDRVARRRGSLGELRYLTAGGRAAIWRDMVNIARSEFIVALGMDDRIDNAMLTLAASVEAWEIEEVLAEMFTDQVSLKVNASELTVEALVERKLGAVTWNSMRNAEPDRQQLCAALASVIRKQGLSILDLPEKVRKLQGQTALILKLDPQCGLPDLSDEALLGQLELLLDSVLPEKLSKNMLKNIDWYQAIYNLLDYAQQRLLSRLLPEKITLENGREFRIDYSGDQPCIAAKLQHFFGVRKQPALLNGKLVLAVVMLSPAGRPVQTTQDIGNFWSGSYKLVRSDLRGRYPKHDWPENP